MNKYLILFLIFIQGIGLTELRGQRIKDSETAKFIADFDFVYNELKNYYVNLPVTEKNENFDLDNLYSVYKAKIAATEDEKVFYHDIKSFLANFRDPNVRIRYKNRAFRGNFLDVPEFVYRSFSCRIIEDKVVTVASGEGMGITGKVLSTINGVPVDQIIDEISDIVQMGRGEAGNKERIVRFNYFLNYFALTNGSTGDKLELGLTDKSGNPETYTINFETPLPPVMKTEKPPIYLGFHFNEIFPSATVLEGNIGYIHIPSFNSNKKTTLEKFAEAVVFLKSKNVKGVIVDIRWADGDLEFYGDLLSYFVAKKITPFNFRFKDTFRFNDLYPGRAEYESKSYKKSNKPAEKGYTNWWEINSEPAKEQFLTGVPVVVLVNEAVSEDAGRFALACKEHTNAELAGTGFTTGGHNLIAPITTSGKKYYLWYSFREIADHNFKSIENRDVTPKLNFVQTLSDYYKGVDTQIEKARSYLIAK